MPIRPSTTYWKASFLANLAETGLVSRAARYAGVTRQTAYNARNPKHRTGTALLEAQAFAQQWDAALDQAADSAELEVRRRAMQGTEHIRDVYRQGQKISTTITHHYSDRLLMFLLEKLRPDTYGNPIPPIPHTCKHCGCNPRSEPSPEEIKGRQHLNAYMDRLIARANAPKPSPVKPQPIPNPADSPNNYSPNPPASVSTSVSSFPEALIPNFDSENSSSFVSNAVSSFQNSDHELNVEYSQSNVGDSFIEGSDDAHVGAQHAAPLPTPSNYLANSDSLNPPLFASSDVSSSPAILLSQHLPISTGSPLEPIRLPAPGCTWQVFVAHSLTRSPHSITLQSSLPPLSRDFSLSGTATEGRGWGGGLPSPEDHFANQSSFFPSSFPSTTLSSSATSVLALGPP